MPETLLLSPDATLTILDQSPEALVVEARYGPTSAAPPEHLHPAQEERFSVLEGTMHTRVAGRERTLRPGDVLDVPAGTPHAMWPGEDGARMRWETRPAGRTAGWFRALDMVWRDAREREDGAPDGAALMRLVGEFSDVFRLAGAPG
jgi:glyoxylate utilization-related uncharacterized protein